MDYGKKLYEEKKQKAEAKKRQHQVQIKEVKFRPGTEEGDYQIKLRNLFFFSSRGRHTRCGRDWSSDVCSSDLVESASRLVDEVSPGVAELVDHVDDLLAEEARGHAESIVSELLEAGAPPKIAARVANLFAVDGAIGLARLSRDTGMASIGLTRAFSDLGERLGLDWAQQRATVMNPSDPWERLLVAGLARDFQQMR